MEGGAHPAHGGAEGLGQAPQAAEVLLEAAELEGGRLVEAAALLAGAHLLLPQVGAGDEEQVTQQELDCLGCGGQDKGSWVSGGHGRTDRWGRGGPRRSLRAGVAARDPRRAAWQGHCTPSLTHAMQLQCTPARVGGTSRQGRGLPPGLGGHLAPSTPPPTLPGSPCRWCPLGGCRAPGSPAGSRWPSRSGSGWPGSRPACSAWRGRP